MVIDLLNEGRIAKLTHLYGMGPEAEITCGSISEEGNTFLVKTLTPRTLVMWWRTSNMLRLVFLEFSEKFRAAGRSAGYWHSLEMQDQVMIL